MAQRPKRSSFSAGRGGAAKYLQAMRTWKRSQEKPSEATTRRKGPGRPSNRVKPKATTPKPRGMSNIPPSEASRNNPNHGKPGNPKSADKRTPAPTYTPPKGSAKPKPKPTKTPTKSKPTKPAATSTKKLTPMQQWAKAHPELAKKLKKGQSGFKELKIGRSTKQRTWLGKNYKPGKN